MHWCSGVCGCAKVLSVLNRLPQNLAPKAAAPRAAALKAAAPGCTAPDPRRFTSEEEALQFVDRIAAELSSRLRAAGLKGRTLCLKIKRRKEVIPAAAAAAIVQQCGLLGLLPRPQRRAGLRDGLRGCPSGV